jgi:hypothetical protein
MAQRRAPADARRTLEELGFAMSHVRMHHFSDLVRLDPLRQLRNTLKRRLG